jgi:hypothetical protein
MLLLLLLLLLLLVVGCSVFQIFRPSTSLFFNFYFADWLDCCASISAMRRSTVRRRFSPARPATSCRYHFTLFILCIWNLSPNVHFVCPIWLLSFLLIASLCCLSRTSTFPCGTTRALQTTRQSRRDRLSRWCGLPRHVHAASWGIGMAIGTGVGSLFCFVLFCFRS